MKSFCSQELQSSVEISPSYFAFMQYVLNKRWNEPEIQISHLQEKLGFFPMLPFDVMMYNIFGDLVYF